MKTQGTIRHDITFTCPVCGHTDTLDMPLAGDIDCDECGEELEIYIEEDGSGEEEVINRGYAYWTGKKD